MRKQLYFVTFILMLMLGVYASYYYSNYKVQNLPVRGAIAEMPVTRFTADLTQKPAADTNVVYAQLRPSLHESPLTLNLQKGSLPDTAFSSKTVLIRAGRFNDSTMGYIRRAESRYFKNNYRHNPGFTNGSSFTFAHYHLEQVFRSNFRYYPEYLPFKQAQVKAITNLPEEPSPDRYQVQHYKPDSTFRHLVVIKRSDEDRLTFAMPRQRQPLKQLYQKAETIIQRQAGDTLRPQDQLVLPLMDFQIHNTYAVADTTKARNSPVQGFTKYTIIMNTQYNVLQKGTRGQSPAKRMVFDQPFLMYHESPLAKGERPLFGIWIGNGTLLLDKDRSSS